MGKHLTDKQKKMIVADYVECQNYSAVARKYKVSDATVRRIVNNDEETTRKVEHKKEENSKDMLSYMDTKKQDAMTFIDLALNEMMKKEKLERSSIQALATSIGIIIDKFTPSDKTSETVEKVVIVNDMQDSKVK